MTDPIIWPAALNWRQILEDLRAAGWPRSRVARSLGRTPSTVQRWHENLEPRYRHGRALLILHRRVCGELLTQQRISEGVAREIT